MRRLSRFNLRRIPRPGPGTVLGMLALMVALGGTAAADLAGTNTVVSNDIAPNAVRASDIATNAVQAPEINTDAVRAPEIRTDAVEEAELDAGSVQDAELGTIVVRSATTAIPDGGSGRAEASCNAGERLIGGGGATQQSASDAIFHGSEPSIGGGLIPVSGNTFSDWNAKATNVAGGLATVDVRAWAICLQ